MKKTILYATLLALSFQSCDYLDREPLDSVTKDQFFTTATGTALQQYCNNFYPKLIKGHGDPLSYSFGMLEKELGLEKIKRSLPNTLSFAFTLIRLAIHTGSIKAVRDDLCSFQVLPKSCVV